MILYNLFCQKLYLEKMIFDVNLNVERYWYWSVKWSYKAISCPGCTIHRQLLCRGVRPHNECPSYDTKQSESAGTLENVEHPFIAITPRSTVARSGCTW